MVRKQLLKKKGVLKGIEEPIWPNCWGNPGLIGFAPSNFGKGIEQNKEGAF